VAKNAEEGRKKNFAINQLIVGLIICIKAQENTLP
jgi:hypothetical protein